MKLKVGVIGLGSMGYGIAQSVLRAGHETYGFDVAPEIQKKFENEGGSVSSAGSTTAATIGPSLDVLIVVVLNAAQTQRVLFGENGVVSRMRSGSVVVACATVPPDFARDMEAQCQAVSVHYLDAPISGGSIKAADGKLSVMASGSAESFYAATPALDAIAETVFQLGDAAGAGSAMKAVNQMLAGTHIAMLAEAITFGMTQGVEPKQFLEVISQCAGSSWMLENRAPHIINGDYTPHSSVDIWPKDLGIVLDIAKSAKFSAPVTAAALQQFIAASGAGFGQEDDAAVAKIYARNANLTLPGCKAE